MNDLGHLLGRRIRKLRRAGGLSQFQLAKRARISTSFLSMIERGLRVPHLSTVARIADAISVSLSEVFRFDVPAPAGPGQEPPDPVRDLV